MPKNLQIADLLCLYGSLLGEKQRSFLELYYFEDLSLSEISENEAITRQGVREAIKRAEQTLFDAEKALGLLEKNKKLSELSHGLHVALEENDLQKAKEYAGLLEQLL